MRKKYRSKEIRDQLVRLSKGSCEYCKYLQAFSLILHFLFLFSTNSYAQSLLQPSYHTYLANSINQSGLSILGEQPYFGIGKKQLWQNLPHHFSAVGMANYSPTLRNSSTFGILRPFPFLPSAYNWSSKINIAGSSFSEWETTAKLAANFNEVENNFVFHLAQNQTKIDRNGDDFLDVPLSKRLFLVEHAKMDFRQLQVVFGAYYLDKEEEDGHLNFETDTTVFAFGNEVEHVGATVQAKIDLEHPATGKEHHLIGQVDGSLHERTDNFGANNYLGNQRIIHALAGYALKVNDVPQLFLGLKFDYVLLKEGFEVFQQERRERSFGFLARYQTHWNKYILSEANLELEQHNLLNTMARPSLRINLLFPKNQTFFVNFFSAYDWRYPNLFTDYSRMFVSDYPIQITPNMLNNWSPNRLWQHGLAARFDDYPYSIKLQYHYFHFQQKTLWDLYQDAEQIQIYSSNERAFRHLLEIKTGAHLFDSDDFRLGATYRWDQNKSTYDETLRLDPFLSEHSFYATLSYRKKGFLGKLNYHVHSPQMLIGLEEVRSPWLHRLDFKLNYTFQYETSKKGLKPLYFSLGIDNLLANQQQDIYFTQEGERATYLNGINLWGIPYGTRFYLSAGYNLEERMFRY